MRRGQQPHPNRQRELLSERGRHPDAGQEGPEATRPQALQEGRRLITMRNLATIAVVALAAATLLLAPSGAHAFDQSLYPDWKGQWNRVGSPRWVPPGEKAPLTPEYQALMEWNLKDV